MVRGKAAFCRPVTYFENSSEPVPLGFDIHQYFYFCFSFSFWALEAAVSCVSLLFLETTRTWYLFLVIICGLTLYSQLPSHSHKTGRGLEWSVTTDPVLPVTSLFGPIWILHFPWGTEVISETLLLGLSAFVLPCGIVETMLDEE